MRTFNQNFNNLVKATLETEEQDQTKAENKTSDEIYRTWMSQQKAKISSKIIMLSVKNI